MPTLSELDRFNVLSRELGCIACLVTRVGYEPADVHHLLSGGKRQGHHQTIPLCPWHHRSFPQNGMNDAQAAFTFGPSLAISKPKFTESYGSEQLLLEVVNYGYEIYQKNPWTILHVKIRFRIINHWRGLMREAGTPVTDREDPNPNHYKK